MQNTEIYYPNLTRITNFKNIFKVRSNSYSILRPDSQVSVICLQGPSRVLGLSSNTCIKSRGTLPWGHP